MFVDLERADEGVPREELWCYMIKSGVAKKYLRVYNDSVISVRCAAGMTEGIKVKVGLHQGSVLSYFLFAIVMDRLTEEFRQQPPWTVMFADIMQCGEGWEEDEADLERLRYALER